MTATDRDIDVERLLLLIRLALETTKASDAELQERIFAPQPDKQEWMKLFHLSVHNSLVAVAYDGVCQLPVAMQPPRSVTLPWMLESEKVAKGYAHRMEVQQSLFEFFEQHGIKTIALKGNTLSRYYPIPEHRASSDIDIYQFGRQKEADRLVTEELKIPVLSETHHHTKYVYNKVLVENHYDFLNIHLPRSNRRFDALLKTLDPTSATFNVLFLARHMARHFVAQRITLRHLCDWGLYLRQEHASVDWPLVKKAFEEYHMGIFVAALQTICTDCLGFEPIAQLPGLEDRQPVDRILTDTICGSDAEKTANESYFGHIRKKYSTFRANRWKYPLCYSDSVSLIPLQSICAYIYKALWIK